MIGRLEEKKILRDALNSEEAEFIAVIGRRRVGKTYLIRQIYNDAMSFEMTGIQHATLSEQLLNFHFSLRQYFSEDEAPPVPENWIMAFSALIKSLEKQKGRKVVFIDELPWIATPRSGFIKGLSFFWNSWASKKNVVLVTCGSAASWMIQKIILNKGGLHNRVTRQIILLPFTLQETKAYLASRQVVYSEYQIAQLYMIMGGIPYYLKLVPKGKSIAQVVTYLLLAKNAPLANEFDNLYQSLFRNYEKYVSVVSACHTKWKGLTHQELATVSGLPSGGSLSRTVKELEVSGFVAVTPMMGAVKKNTTIRVIDEFSIFYLKFIMPNRTNNWSNITSSKAFTAWQGFAFENLCLRHIDSIKAALGIRGVATRQYSYYLSGDANTQGVQIDMIIDRDDHIVNLCEIKFYNTEFTINKSTSENLSHRLAALQRILKPTQSIHLTLLSTFGVKSNKYSSQILTEVVLSDLFG